MKSTVRLVIFVILGLLPCSDAFVPVQASTATRAHAPTQMNVKTLTVLAAYKKPTTTYSANKQNSNKNKKNEVVAKGDDEKGGVFSKPANLIFLPFVAIFGLDLVLNILVVVKRTIEVALTGQYTCTGPWC